MPESPDDDLEKLEQFEHTRGKLRLPLEVKPCIMSLLNGSPGAKEGDNPFIIACELHRVGKDEKQIEAVLTRIGVKQAKLRRALKSALTGKYSFGCPTLEERGLCLYRSRFDCWWHARIPRQNQKSWRERDFWRYGWPQKLRSTEAMIYLAVREVEKKRRITAGSWVYISWDELQKTSGVARNTIKKSLIKLTKVGLIDYKEGEKRRVGVKGLATQIKRVIPIPRPKK